MQKLYRDATVPGAALTRWTKDGRPQRTNVVLVSCHRRRKWCWQVMSPQRKVKALLVTHNGGNPSKICSFQGKGCALNPLRLLAHDPFFEYSADAYAAKLMRVQSLRWEWKGLACFDNVTLCQDDRYWFGCHAALALQPDLTPGMRKTLLLWLLEVVRQFNYTLETWCMTVR
jgi:hypothetical protein